MRLLQHREGDRLPGRTTSIGLRAYPFVTLAAAREKALDYARNDAERRMFRQCAILCPRKVELMRYRGAGNDRSLPAGQGRIEAMWSSEREWTGMDLPAP